MSESIGENGRELPIWVVRARDFVRARRLQLAMLCMASTWLGVSWVVYRAEFGQPGSNITSYPDSLWWGLVTFLTVGYGDRYPVTVEGRLASSLLMFAGVISIAILTSKISSSYLKDVLLEGRNIVDRRKLSDHLVICGYKPDYHQLLYQMLKVNKNLSPKNIVIVANITDAMIAEVRQHKDLEEVQFIRGNFFQEEVLKKAAPERARKVMILADLAPSSNGRASSAAEADARVIMTAITLSRIAKNTQVSAEILDQNLEQHLQLSGVSEIIYSREYSRLILGSASKGTGISNVIYGLLDPSTRGFIDTAEIGEDEVGRAYKQFKKDYETSNEHSVVIGILENTGNPARMKELAVREAQKTASVTALIDNLKSVKSLRCNTPLFHPACDYKIKRGSSAIVIRHDGKKIGVGRAAV